MGGTGGAIITALGGTVAAGAALFAATTRVGLLASASLMAANSYMAHKSLKKNKRAHR